MSFTLPAPQPSAVPAAAILLLASALIPPTPLVILSQRPLLGPFRTARVLGKGFALEWAATATATAILCHLIGLRIGRVLHFMPVVVINTQRTRTRRRTLLGRVAGSWASWTLGTSTSET